MAPNGGILKPPGVVHDVAKTIRKHMRSGAEAARDLRRGRAVHVFDDGIDLTELEAMVWSKGSALGRIGDGQRAKFERFIWEAPAPIGKRVKLGQEAVALRYVEIKLDTTTGKYHLCTACQASRLTARTLRRSAMKSEWWYDGSVLEYETFGDHKQELYLARLTVKDDGTAELLFPSGARKPFPTEEDASLWLGDEEFRRLEDLMQDFMDDGRPVDPRIKRPPSGPDAEILKQMHIPLGPEAATAS